MRDDLENYKPPTSKEIRAGKLSDPKYLQSITDKELEVIAIIERLEDVIWIEGEETTVGDKKEIMKGEFTGRPLEEQKRWWKEIFKSVEEEECWKNGKHSGDCTKVPAPCNRCMCECHLYNARRFIKFFNGPYNENNY